MAVGQTGLPQAMAQFDRIQDRVDVQSLAKKLVVVVGVGTVGSQIARELANSAVGRLRLIDDDRLESQNLPRHALTSHYVGMNKAEAMAVSLTENVTTLHAEALPRKIDKRLSDRQLDRLLADADLIVAATDDRDAQRRLGRRALSLGIPAVFPALYGDQGGEVFVQLTPEEACFFCWDGFRTGDEQLRGVAALNADGLAILQLAVHLVLGILDPSSSLARQLAGTRADPRPRQLFIQRPYAALSLAPVPRRPNCPSCEVGPPPGASATQPRTPSNRPRRTSQPANESPAPNTGTTTTSQQALIESATDVLAVLLATGALVWPFLWMSFATLAAFVVICTRDIRIRGVKHGPADLIVIPLRVIRTGATWLILRIVAIVPVAIAIVWLCFCAVIALAIPFVIGGAIWFVTHGVDGLLAAARLAAADYGLRAFALLTCYLCFHWILSRGSITDLVQIRARTLSESSLAAAAGIAIISFVLCGFVLPQHIWAPASGLNELISHAPPGIQGPISNGRAALARYEARAVVQCLADHSWPGWQTPRASVRTDGSIAVIVDTSASRPPSSRSMAVLALALENQLAHHVDTIALAGEIRYAPRADSSSVADVAALARSATSTADAKRISKLSLKRRDVKVALRCSAVAI